MAALLAVAAAGCGTVPASGPVHLGREVAAGGARVDFDVRVLPPPPTEGDSPGDVVHGFLVASVNADDDSSIARQYLTRRAAAGWNPLASVTLYDEPSLSIDVRPGATVVVTATRLGIVGADGDYHPAPGTLSVTLHLQREGKEWRIKDPPKGRLSMTLDATRSSRAQDVYFLDPTQQIVVPDRVLFRVPRNGLPTALVRALVAGPTGWLRPAVSTAIPAGTRLLGNVPVNNGVADVNLSREVLNAGPQSRPALSAQIVWTLRQLPTVTAVRVFADGVPLNVPGMPQRQQTDAWEQYDPDASGDSRLRYVADGAVQIDGAGPIPASPQGSLSRPAVARNGTVIAAVVAMKSRATVYYGSARSRLTPRVTGAAVTAPSFDRSDVAWTVVTDASGGQRVVRLLSSGRVDPVNAAALLRLGDVRDLQLSRDATRVAAVVGERGSTHLVVGRVTVDRSGAWSIDGFRDPMPEWTDIAGVAWSDAEHVVTLARSPSAPRARRVPVQTDVTGYALTALPVNGLPPDVDHLAAAPGRPIVAASADGMWMSTLGTWRALGRGSDPTYPG